MSLSIVIVLIIFPLLSFAQPGSKHLTADAILNLRAFLSDDDRLLGYIAGLMIHQMDDEAIRQDIRFCMDSLCPPDYRLNNLITRARNEAIFGATRVPLSTPLYPPDTVTIQLMTERVNIASQFLQAYQQDVGVLDRLIAVDEMWVVQSELLLIAATFRDRIIAYRFVRDHGMNRNDFRSFIREELSNAIREYNIHMPTILIDNLRTHITGEVSQALVEAQIRVWLNPRYSQDMMPLDIDTFDCIRQRVSEDCYTDRDNLINAVIEAIEDINRSNCLRSMGNLPLIWQEVISRQGGSRRPSIVTTTLASDDIGSVTRRRRDIMLGGERILSMGITVTAACKPNPDRQRTGATCRDSQSGSLVSNMTYSCQKGICWSSCVRPVYDMTRKKMNHVASHKICPTTRDGKKVEPCVYAADCNPCWNCVRECSKYPY